MQPKPPQTPQGAKKASIKEALKNQFAKSLSISEDKDTAENAEGKRFEDSYEFVKILAQSAQAITWQVQKKGTSDQFSAKVTRIGDSEAIVKTQQEHKNLQSLSHENIAKSLEIFVDQGKAVSILVTELADGPTLEEYLHENNRLKESEAVPIFRQLLSAIEHMHSRQIAHRNIGGQAVRLAKGNTRAMLVDLAVSRNFQNLGGIGGDGLVTPKMVTETGNVLRRAPEMLKGEGYDESVDVWALGCLAYESLFGVNPFAAESVVETVEKIGKGQFTLEVAGVNVSDAAKDFISACLIVDRTKRPSAKAALDHSWLKAQHALDDQTMLAIVVI